MISGVHCLFYSKVAFPGMPYWTFKKTVIFPSNGVYYSIPKVLIRILIHVLTCKYVEQLPHEYSWIHDLCQHLHLAPPINIVVLGQILLHFN